MNTTATATATDQKFYVIETNFVDRESGDKVEIRTAPARTNQSHEERLSGWCGTTNNRAVYAHGEYSTLDAARAAIALLFDVQGEGDDEESDDEELVETYFLKDESDEDEDED